MKIISTVLVLTLLASLGLAGASCMPIVETKTGTIEVRVTDAPKYDVTSIMVKVSTEEGEGVKARRVVDDGEGEWEPIDIIADKNPLTFANLGAAYSRFWLWLLYPPASTPKFA